MTHIVQTRRRGYVVLMHHKKDHDDRLVIWGRWVPKALRSGIDGVSPYIFGSVTEAVDKFGESRNGFYLTCVVYVDLDAGCSLLDSTGETFC